MLANAWIVRAMPYTSQLDNFLEIAKSLLTATARIDTRRTSSKRTKSNANGHAPANRGKARPHDQAEEYRTNAAKCLQQSEAATGSKEEAPWLKITKEWQRRADAASRNPDGLAAL